MTKFKTFNISSWLISNLENNGFINLTPIQEKVIPLALKGKSLVVKSETGSGKTLAFLVPILNNINEDLNNLQTIIIVPTKELAEQIYNETIKLINGTNIKVKLIKSGVYNDELAVELSQNPQIIIGTIGKLNDLIIKNDSINLKYVNTIILDETDMLLDNGFINDVDNLLSIFNDPQILVFSASINKSFQNVLEKYLGSEFSITSDNTDITSSNVTHYAIDIKHNDPKECIYKLIKHKNPYCMMIFVSEKKDMNTIYEYLNQKGIKTTILNGDLSKQERKNVILNLKKGKIQYLLCSDLAARGLDVDDIDLVLSYNLPNNLEYYYHRAGRTGRYNKKGDSYIFYNVDTSKKVLDLLNEGLKINFLKFNNNELIEGQALNNKKTFKNKKNDELDKELNKVKQNHKKNIKPGYKKKYNQEVQKVKSKFRREKIKKEIRKQRVERYKEEAKSKNY